MILKILLASIIGECIGVLLGVGLLIFILWIIFKIQDNERTEK